MLYGLYYITGTVVHAVLVLFVPVLKLLVPGWDIEQRLGNYSGLDRTDPRPVIWIHAASVGEVQAARVLIQALTANHCDGRFFLTTTSRQGREVAVSRLSVEVRCALAPLDTPGAVARSLKIIRPSLYICLETELWPMMLTRIRQAGIPGLLLNGRMSERSLSRYLLFRKTMAGLLGGFVGCAVISRQDGERYHRLGMAENGIRVCGNMKYELQVDDLTEIRRQYQAVLQPGNKKVFICGSTRTGEEQLLLPVYRKLQAAAGMSVVWIIAPRHLERVPEIKNLLDRADLEYELFSRCLRQGRSRDVVILDSMGCLTDLYVMGDYNFCGGSLVDKGGHNIMEPISRHKPVYFGPFMKDFQDGVELVLSANAGFQVQNAGELANLLADHINDGSSYRRTCRAAARLADLQQGAVQCQADMVLQQLSA